MVNLTNHFAFTISKQIPAATVIPISLIANLASSGNSDCFSITIGFNGFTLILAASPVLMKSGFSCITAPVLGSIFAIISSIVHAVLDVWQWNTGVYPAVSTVGWFKTIIWAVNSLTTDGGLLGWPATSPLCICSF